MWVSDHLLNNGCEPASPPIKYIVNPPSSDIGKQTQYPVICQELYLLHNPTFAPIRVCWDASQMTTHSTCCPTHTYTRPMNWKASHHSYSRDEQKPKTSRYPSCFRFPSKTVEYQTEWKRVTVLLILRHRWQGSNPELHEGILLHKILKTSMRD